MARLLSEYLSPAQHSGTSDGIHHETLSQNKAEEELLKKIVTFNLVSTDTEAVTMNTYTHLYTDTQILHIKQTNKKTRKSQRLKFTGCKGPGLTPALHLLVVRPG